MPNIKVIFGGAGVNSDRGFTTVDSVKELLDVLESQGIDTIDTARLYGASEGLLGQAGAPSRFIIDTKIPGGFVEEALQPANLKKNVETSLQELGVKKVLWKSIPGMIG